MENTEALVDRVPVRLKTGSSVLYSKYSGTEIELDGSSLLLLKEDDVIGVLETDDDKELKPLNDVVLIKVAEVEEKTDGGLLLTDAAREKPSIGTVIELCLFKFEPLDLIVFHLFANP